MIKKINICFILITILTLSKPLSATDNVNASTSTNTIELLDQQLENEIGKVVYVDFWASWCIPCRKSFPWMNDLKAQYKLSLIHI